MAASVSFVGEGAGDMAVVECGDGSTLMIDSRLAPDNKAMAMPSLFVLADASQIDIFFALNVGPDRVVGLADVTERMFVRRVWDTGVTPDLEFDGIEAYKKLRSQIGVEEIDEPVVKTFGTTRIGVVRARHEAATGQAGGPMILRIAELDPGSGAELGSVLFASDATADFWDEALAILPPEIIRADVLVAGSHGGPGFFARKGLNDDPTPETLKALDPSIVIIGAVPDKASEFAASRAALTNFVAADDKRELFDLAEEGGTAFTIDEKGVSVESDDGIRLLKAA